MVRQLRNEKYQGWTVRFSYDNRGRVIARSNFSNVQIWQGQTKKEAFEEFKFTIDRYKDN